MGKVIVNKTIITIMYDGELGVGIAYTGIMQKGWIGKISGSQRTRTSVESSWRLNEMMQGAEKIRLL